MAVADDSVIALFPLHTVLFPGGPLPLRIFEARYTDMVGRCSREQQPFGVVLIHGGEEAGEVATTATIGWIFCRTTGVTKSVPSTKACVKRIVVFAVRPPKTPATTTHPRKNTSTSRRPAASPHTRPAARKPL